jgi:hypothetical protein
MSTESQSLHDKLNVIQSELKAPKDLHNKFGNYDYRSAESILMSLKPFLKRLGVDIVLSDHIEQIGERYYISATATITDGRDSVSSTAYAREEFEKKGMDASQITGSASSYARKYALNGLFAIDDTKDADTLNVTNEFTEPTIPEDIQELRDMVKNDINLATKKETLRTLWKENAHYFSTYKKIYDELFALLTAKGKSLKE